MAASAVAPVSVPATSAKPALKRPREKSNNEDGRPSPMPSHGEIYVSRHRPTMPRGTSSPVGVDEVVDEDVGEDVGEDVDEVSDRTRERTSHPKLPANHVTPSGL